MMIPQILWPLAATATDAIDSAACAVFAFAHWAMIISGQPIADDAIIAAYQAERAARGNPAGLAMPEAFFAAHRAGWLPPGTTLRRTDDLARLVHGPLIAAYRVRDRMRRARPDGTFDNAGFPAPRTHAVCIIGWDGTHVVFANSWGPQWGDNGIGRMTIEQHRAMLTEMYQIVVPGQPSTPQEAAAAAADAIPDDLADQVRAVHRNLIALGYPGLPTTATIIMPDIIRRSMAGELTPDQERAKSNLAHVYTMLLLQGIGDAQINAVHAATGAK